MQPVSLGAGGRAIHPRRPRWRHQTTGGGSRMKKKISVSLAIAIAIIAMTVTFSVTMILAMKLFDRTVSDVNEKQAMYNKLAEIDKSVRDNFYTEIDDQTLYDMIAGCNHIIPRSTTRLSMI